MKSYYILKAKGPMHLFGQLSLIWAVCVNMGLKLSIAHCRPTELKTMVTPSQNLPVTSSLAEQAKALCISSMVL